MRDKPSFKQSGKKTAEAREQLRRMDEYVATAEDSVDNDLNPQPPQLLPVDPYVAQPHHDSGVAQPRASPPPPLSWYFLTHTEIVRKRTNIPL